MEQIGCHGYSSSLRSGRPGHRARTCHLEGSSHPHGLPKMPERRVRHNVCDQMDLPSASPVGAPIASPPESGRKPFFRGTTGQNKRWKRGESQSDNDASGKEARDGRISSCARMHLRRVSTRFSVATRTPTLMSVIRFLAAIVAHAAPGRRIPLSWNGKKVLTVVRRSARTRGWRDRSRLVAHSSRTGAWMTAI